MSVAPAGHLPGNPLDLPSSRAGLTSWGFVGLNIVFLFASASVSSFFHLQPYLESLGMAPAWVGFVISADSLASFFLQPLLAPFLHAGNARRWMVSGIMVMALSLLAYSHVEGLASLVIVRILQGAGFVCLISALMAAMVSYIPPSLSGQAFGIISLVRLVPFAFIPPLVGFLLGRYLHFPGVLGCFAVLMLLSIPILLLMRPPSPDGGGQNSASVGLKGLIEDLKDPPVLLLLGANLVFFVTYTIVFFYLAGLGREAGISRTPLFFTIATSAMIAVRLFGNPFFDRVNKSAVACLCLIALAIAFPLLARAGEWDFLALATFFGLAWGISIPLMNALLFDVSRPAFRGLNINLAIIAMQGGFFLGPLAGGVVLGAWGYNVVFYLCSPLCLICAFLLRKIPGRREKEFRDGNQG
jgi:predicted MFS family arabinose efflux permease